VKVLIPSPLLSYTGRSWVDAEGGTLGELLLDLDRRYPGIRFRMIDEQDRMRPHVRFFVNGEQTFDLGLPVGPADAVCIVQALSGG
jgi:sulfur-carrier protein